MNGWRALARGACRISLAAALAAFGCAGVGSERPAPPAATATPLFWHAQALAGGEFYLLGSVHVGEADAPALAPEIAQAYERSDQLVVEIDASQITPDEVAAQTQRYALLPPQLRLDALLVSTVDNVLRLLLISGPTQIPFLLVLFGVLGGVSTLGLLGLFVGPVVLSVAFALLAEFGKRPAAGAAT